MVGRASLVLGLAAAANAFLLPTEMIKGDIEALSFENVLQAQDRTVDLPCTHCPVLVAEVAGHTVYKLDLESMLGLSFTVGESDKASQALMLNGVQIYPPTPALSSVYAVQTAEGAPMTHVALGFELQISPVKTSDKDSLELTSINFQVVEVGGRFISGLQSVQVNLLKTPSGALMIGGLETVATRNPIVNPAAAGKACKTLICKWRASIAGKMPGMGHRKGGCRKGGANRKTFPSGAPRPHHRHGGPYHQGHHGMHHRGGMRVLQTLQSIVLHIVVPAIIGIAVGFTASLIGMIVGNLIVFLWRAFYRRGQPSRYSRVQEEEYAEEDEKVLMDNQAPPPVYEDSPVYEPVEDEKEALGSK